MLSAELVFFAVGSALKLGLQARAAYVDSIRRRAFVLPLPNYDYKPNIADALEYFKGAGKHHIPESELLKRLQVTIEQSDMIADIIPHLEEDQKSELVALHNDFVTLDLVAEGFDFGQPSDGYVSGDDLSHLLKIRQWRKGNDPSPTVLRRFAGTFIDIGVNYFSNYPGALNKDSRTGRAVFTLLNSLDAIDFSDELNDDGMGDLLGRLFTATLETVSENSDLLSADPKYQQLIAVTSSALVTDVAGRIHAIRKSSGGAGNEDKEVRIKAWAELIFRSVLSGGGHFVLSNPKEYLGINDPVRSEAAEQVGRAVLSFVLDQPQGELDRVFGRQGLDVVVKAGLAVIGKHPELISDIQQVGLKNLLSQVSTELGRFPVVLNTGILPELARLILDKTGENLSLYWPDWAAKPERHLLVTAARQALDILTVVPPDANWQLHFTRDDLLILTAAVLDEFCQNPGWLIDRAGKANENLVLALKAMAAVLRRQNDKRLSTRAAVDILCAGLKAAALRQEFLNKLPDGSLILASILDALLAAIFRPQADRASWTLVRHEVISGSVQAVFSTLAQTEVSPAALEALRAFMNVQIKDINSGKPWSLELFKNGLKQAI